MKAVSLSALALLTTSSLFGQNLVCNETIIRANESFTVQLDLSSFYTQIENQLPGYVTLENDPFSSQIEFDVVSQQVGPMTVGPFTFDWNGTTVTTDSIVVNVLPELVLNDMVQISYLETKDGCFLITEQLVKDGDEDDDYVTLNSEAYRGKRFNHRSMLRTSRYEVNGDKYAYRRTVYSIEGDGEYIPIDETLFKNLPENVVWGMEQKVRGRY